MPEPSARAGGRTARPGASRRRRHRWLPRTGPKATWPSQAHRAGQIAVLVTVLLLICGFLLIRYSPERYLRLVDVYRSLPVAVVIAVLVSGVIYFALDSLRLVLTDYLAVAHGRRAAATGPATDPADRAVRAAEPADRAARAVVGGGRGDPWRRRLLLGMLGLWLLLTVIAAVLILWYPSWVLFGGGS